MSHHKYYPCEQYSEEWTRRRIGIPTASGFHNIITPTRKPTDNKDRKKYKYRLVAERLLQQCMDDNYESYWMRRGSELEDQAIQALKKHTNRIQEIRKVGFYTALGDKVGASPDGEAALRAHFGVEMVDGVEIKCPKPDTQVEYHVAGLGDNYKAQVQGQMYVCRWDRVHFWSFHPSMPPFYQVSHRDEDFIVKLEPALLAFCAELDEAEAHCRGLGSYRLAEKLRLSDEMAEAKTLGDILEAL